MAIVKNDPFPGTDYNKYQEWEKIVLPSGEVFYTVPGNPAYVFDPVASNATGRKVFRRNPKEAIAADQQQKDAQAKAIKQQQFNQSPLGQLLPVGASLGGLYLANKVASGGLPSLPSLDLGGSGAAEVSTNADSAAQGFFGGSSGAAEGAYQVGTNADGSILMSDGSSLAAEGAGIGAGQVLGAIGAAKGTYDTIKGFQQGGEGVRSGLTTAGAGIGTMLMPGLGTIGGAAVGNLAGYGLQGKGIKNDLALLGAASIAGPVGLIGAGGLIAARRLGFDPIHKTTRQVAQEHTQDLLKQAGDDEVAKNYVSGMREQFNAPPPDKENPFMGKYKTFDEYKTAGLNADNLSGVYGNISTYGAKEWANLTNEQRRAVTQKNIDAGNYTSKKGEVEFVDKELAKKLKDEALGLNVQVKGAAPIQVPGSVVDAAANASLSKGPKWIIRDGKTVKVA